jgi:hypothetical protein
MALGHIGLVFFGELHLVPKVLAKQVLDLIIIALNCDDNSRCALGPQLLFLALTLHPTSRLLLFQRSNLQN